MFVVLGVTVVVALLALGFALGIRAQVARMSRGFASDLDRLSQALGDVRRDLGDLQRELAEVRSAAESAPIPPPLPRARSGRLDDLREQLRASHRESETVRED